jgi:cystathionine beta-lyase/cystathionine gamma-synthase
MVKPFPSKTHIGNHMLHPETLMLNYGYDPQLSEGAVKPPVFLTSTFVFRTAEDGQDFFDFVSGRREPPEGMGAGLVYSRFNHPNSEIVGGAIGNGIAYLLARLPIAGQAVVVDRQDYGEETGARAFACPRAASSARRQTSSRNC